MYLLKQAMNPLRRSPQRQARKRGYWPPSMTLDIPPGCVSTALKMSAVFFLVLVLYSLWNNSFTMFVYAMLPLVMLSKLTSFVFFFYFRFTPNTIVRVL